MSPQRCHACEGPLVTKPSRGQDDHIQPSLMCPSATCPMGGVCLTCVMLVEWFRSVDGG